MWSIFRLEDRLYVSVHWGCEPEALVCEDFGLDDECRVLHDITVQGGERACGWEGYQDMS